MNGVNGTFNKEYSTPGIQKLQYECTKNHPTSKKANLSKFQLNLLNRFSSAHYPVLEGKKIQIEPCQKNIEKAIMALLVFQRWMPNMSDVKCFSEIFAKLFAHLSVEMYKLEDSCKKKEREKRFKRKIENSEKSKEMGK